jgi:hypothetical protein
LVLSPSQVHVVTKSSWSTSSTNINMNDSLFNTLEGIIREGEVAQLIALLNRSPEGFSAYLSREELHQLLYRAVQSSKLPFVHALCDLGADVNRFNCKSEPLLVVATRDSSEEVALLLKSYGATVLERYLFSTFNYYPYHYAMQSEQTNLVNLFRFCTKITLRCNDRAKERCDFCNALHCESCWRKHEKCGRCGKKSCKMCLNSNMRTYCDGWYCTEHCYTFYKSLMYIIDNLTRMTNENELSDCDVHNT